MPASIISASHNPHIFRPFPTPQTARQWFYLAFLQGFGAGIVDGGLNFLVAWAMYHNQPVVKMWVFSESTIAGDLGVTPIIQCLASMLITSTLVHTDLHHKAVRPLPFVYPHVEHLPDPRSLFQRRTTPDKLSAKSAPEVVVVEPKHQPPSPDEDAPDAPSSTTTATAITPAGTAVDADEDTQPRKGFVYYYWMLVRFIFEGTEKNMMLERVGVANWFGRLIWTAAQGAAIGIIFGFPLWCLAVLILGPIYGTRNMGGKWAPEAIKCVYGAIVGWVTNPVIATLALGSQAEHHLILVENEEDTESHAAAAAEANARAGDVEAGLGVPTIHEDEEYFDPGHPRANRFASDATGSPVPSTRRPSTLAVPLEVGAVTPTRPRAGTVSSRHSYSSSTANSPRPPLTANISNLPQLALLPPPPAVVGTTPRSRRATVSSQVSSTGSFAYALGGTGGRARRSRAESVYSARSANLETLQPSSATNSPLAPIHPQASAPPGLAAFSFSGSPQATQGLGLATEPTTRRRANTSEFRSPSARSSLAVPTYGSSHAASTPSSPSATVVGTGAGDDSTRTPVWDVFGRRESAPVVTRRGSDVPPSRRESEQ